MIRRRTRCIVLIAMAVIGLVWINIFLYKDGNIAGDWPHPDGEKPISTIQVVLLSHYRSGSSFLGELLSSCDSCSYFFEPLYYERVIRKNRSAEAYRNSIQNIFSCKKEILDELKHFELYPDPEFRIVRKLGNSVVKNNSSKFDVVNLCKKDTMHVVKTVRLRVGDFEPLWTKMPSIKIVHLVRDPRAVGRSLKGKEKVWKQLTEAFCTDVYRDVVAARKFPPESMPWWGFNWSFEFKYPPRHAEMYHVVRYEDLVFDTLNVTKSIYAFLGLDLTPAVESFIQRHTKAEKDPKGKKVAHQYFSTFRKSSYQVDQWKTELSPEFIAEIERSCSNVMDLLGYEAFAQQSRKQSQNKNKQSETKT